MMLFDHVTFETLIIDTHMELQSGAQGDMAGYTNLGCLNIEVVFEVTQWMVEIT